MHFNHVHYVGIVQRGNRCDYFTSPRIQTFVYCTDNKEVTWNNIGKAVELPGLCNIICRFSKIFPQDRFICERPAENERMQINFVFIYGCILAYM